MTDLTTSEAVTRTMEAVSGARSRRVWAQDTPAIPPPRTTKSALALRSLTSWAISLLQMAIITDIKEAYTILVNAR